MIFSINLQNSLKKKLRNSFSEMLKLVFKMLKFVFKMLKLVLKTPKLLSPAFSLQGLGWMSHKKSLMDVIGIE